MSDDPYAERRKLTFAQAEGAAPLPRQLKLKEISKELRARLWGVVYQHSGLGERSVSTNWWDILQDRHTNVLHKMIDDFSFDRGRIRQELRNIFDNGNYVDIFEFLQFVMRHEKSYITFSYKIKEILNDTYSAYRVIDDNTIIPISSEAEFQTLQLALADLDASEFHGSRHHLKEAASLVTAGDYPGSVRESVHAVESVARTITDTGMLADALTRLEKQTGIHPALKQGFSRIYGYTNDEKGIRHPLIDEPFATVDETDALFMIGACAAFVSYLINKARTAGLLDKR